MRVYMNLFDKIADPENLFLAWDTFRKGKRGKEDVQEFEKDLEQNIFKLHRDLKNKVYKHWPYKGFFINDPKKRHIHKAQVRDRVLHHAMFQVINPIFEPTFFTNSFSCQVGKGSHRGVRVLGRILRRESCNNTLTCYVLKCDVRKFFDSMDHRILLEILGRRINDKDVMWLLEEIVGSYRVNSPNLFHNTATGVPIGNLTSQLFANVYMNELDQFVKHGLKVKHYARYTDDLVIISRSKEYLENLIPQLNEFLEKNLRLSFHPDKVTIHFYSKGVDFLGYVVFPYHILLRKRTKRRILRKFQGKLREHKEGKINRDRILASLNSNLGVLSHANAYNLSCDLKNMFWFGANSQVNDN